MNTAGSICLTARTEREIHTKYTQYNELAILTFQLQRTGLQQETNGSIRNYTSTPTSVNGCIFRFYSATGRFIEELLLDLQKFKEETQVLV